MVYVLCGCDCAGKSTVFNMLMQTNKKALLEGDISFIKESKLDDAKSMQAAVEYFYMSVLNGHNVIYDRAVAIDEIVYSPILKKNRFPLEEEVLDFIWKHKSEVRFLYFDINAFGVKSRMLERGDEHVNEGMVEDIINAYDSLIMRLPSSTVCYINADDNVFSVYSQVAECIISE